MSNLTVRNRLLLKLGIAVTLLFPATACGQASGNKDMLAPTGPHAEAKTIFKANCISCHGTDLRGRAGKNTDLITVGNRLSQTDLVQVITNGRGVMPKFSGTLTEQEINAVAEWLSELK